jgi:hypothetical protein
MAVRPAAATAAVIVRAARRTTSRRFMDMVDMMFSKFLLNAVSMRGN